MLRSSASVLIILGLASSSLALTCREHRDWGMHHAVTELFFQARTELPASEKHEHEDHAKQPGQHCHLTASDANANLLVPSCLDCVIAVMSAPFAPKDEESLSANSPKHPPLIYLSPPNRPPTAAL